MSNRENLAEVVVNHKSFPKTVALVGNKAWNLCLLPSDWVPPFFVVTNTVHQAWLERGSISLEVQEKLNKEVTDVIEGTSNSRTSELIVRQSIYGELLKDRGRYLSFRSEPDKLTQSLVESWKGFHLNSSPANIVAIIVQQYIEPSAKGHLSNERRVSRYRSQWTCEYELPEPTASLIASEKGSRANEYSPLHCEDSVQLQECLRKVAGAVLARFRRRCHLEWVWNGERLWIVQIDFEDRRENKSSRSLQGSVLCPTPPPKVSGSHYFKSAIAGSRSWHKLDCVSVFAELGLPYPTLYVLDHQEVLEHLTQGEELPLPVINELDQLSRYPLIFRTEVLRKEPLAATLLPRSNILQTLKEALSFLFNTAAVFSQHGLSPGEFCFIAHHFIYAPASAWGFGDIESRTVHIDSTWGSPDGLLFYPHDSFTVAVDHRSDSSPIKKEIRYKPYVIEAGEEGRWAVRENTPPRDWRPSLTTRQIRTISRYSQIISAHLGVPQQVMFLVGVDSIHSNSGVLPWVFNSAIVNEDEQEGQRFDSTTLNAERVRISNSEDVKLLRSRVFSKEQVIVELSPDQDLLRAKDAILELASICKQHGFIINLEGSKLSHIYYILTRAGAIVV